MRMLLASVTVALAAISASLPAFAQEIPNIPAVTGGWQEKYWTGPDGTKFHYFEMGSGTPVILIHGSGGTAMNWMANGLGANLAKTNKVYAIDMRGHGQNGRPRWQAPEAHAEHGPRRAGLHGRDEDPEGSHWRLLHGWLDHQPGDGARRSGSSLRTSAAQAYARWKAASSPRWCRRNRRARPHSMPKRAVSMKRGRLQKRRRPASATIRTIRPTCHRSPYQRLCARPALDLTKINFPILAVVGEFDQPYARTHRLWREAPNFQRVILKNRGHLSSYMADMTPEAYRDALTDFVVRNKSEINPASRTNNARTALVNPVCWSPPALLAIENRSGAGCPQHSWCRSSCSQSRGRKSNSPAGLGCCSPDKSI